MNKYAQTYLNQVTQKLAEPGSMASAFKSIGTPITSNGGLYGRGGLFNPNVASPGVPPSRRGNYMTGMTNPGIAAGEMIGKTLRRSIPGLAAIDAVGAAGKAIGGGLGTVVGGAFKNSVNYAAKKTNLNFDSLKSQMSPGLKGLQMGADLAKQIQSPAPQMRTSAAPFGVRQIPNGQMIMPSQKQMIEEGQMDLANYGKGSVSETPSLNLPNNSVNKQNIEEGLRKGKYKLLDDKGNPVEIPPLY